jgi:aspartate ammonia-lyase
VAACLLDTCDLLAQACDILRRHCVEGIEADEARCRAHVEGSTAAATVLLPALGYETASRLAKQSKETGRTIRELALDEGLLTSEVFDALISPESVCRLGMP